MPESRIDPPILTDERICCRTWMAPRVDVPESLDVHHVCSMYEIHIGPCTCCCGAVEIRRRDDG